MQRAISLGRSARRGESLAVPTNFDVDIYTHAPPSIGREATRSRSTAKTVFGCCCTQVCSPRYSGGREVFARRSGHRCNYFNVLPPPPPLPILRVCTERVCRGDSDGLVFRRYFRRNRVRADCRARISIPRGLQVVVRESIRRFKFPHMRAPRALLFVIYCAVRARPV